MGFFQKASGILGMNARNLLFISKYNSAADKNFADDKLYTKNFLESRGIGVAKLYRVLNNHDELQHLHFPELPESFVVKPNHGYGGEGIIVVSKKHENHFETVSGRKVTFDELFLHCTSILDGRFSISGLADKVLIEERLIPHKVFDELTDIGLPDIRVVVFNLVPVMAMLRVPTRESEGKANVHLGGFGVGIDIGMGVTNGAVQRNKRVGRFPNGRTVRDFQIPFWNDILLAASKVQAVTNIGFVAIDFVITTTGIKILEVNARAGLMIQIANRAPLRARLEKVKDVKVPTAEKGVRVAKTLFSQKVHTAQSPLAKKPVIGLYEPVTYLAKKSKNIQILAKIHLHETRNLLDSSLLDPDQKVADIVVSGERLRLPVESYEFSNSPFKMVLAGKYLTDFFVDPGRGMPEKMGPPVRKGDRRLLQNIDSKVCAIDEKIKLLSYFRPQNLEAEKESFLAHPLKSPHFFYKVPTLDFEELRRDLRKIPRECEHPLMPLYLKKIAEIELKLDLIEAIDTPLLQEISEKIWGEVSDDVYAEALQFLKAAPLEEDTSRLLTSPEIIDRIRNFLDLKKLKHWEISILDSTVADFQITKSNSFLIRKDVQVTENHLAALLAHEIETHVYRLENGRRSPLQLFERGTAGYLRTEEGLAMYNQMQVGVPLGEKGFRGAYRLIGCHLAAEMSFVDLFQHLRQELYLSSEAAWTTCLKAKRGLMDTGKKIAFVKDAVYFIGQREVEEYLHEQPEKIKELYRGKMAITDLEIIQNSGEEPWACPFLPSENKAVFFESGKEKRSSFLKRP